jgi:hypothetical protein
LPQFPFLPALRSGYRAKELSSFALSQGTQLRRGFD